MTLTPEEIEGLLLALKAEVAVLRARLDVIAPEPEPVVVAVVDPPTAVLVVGKARHESTTLPLVELVHDPKIAKLLPAAVIDAIEKSGASAVEWSGDPDDETITIL